MAEVGWRGVNDKPAFGLMSLHTWLLFYKTKENISGGKVENTESPFMVHSVPIKIQGVPCG